MILFINNWQFSIHTQVILTRRAVKKLLNVSLQQGENEKDISIQFKNSRAHEFMPFMTNYDKEFECKWQYSGKRHVHPYVLLIVTCKSQHPTRDILTRQAVDEMQISAPKVENMKKTIHINQPGHTLQHLVKNLILSHISYK